MAKRLMTETEMMRALSRMDTQLTKMVDHCIEGAQGNKKFHLLLAARQGVFNAFINIMKEEDSIVLTHDTMELVKDIPVR